MNYTLNHTLTDEEVLNFFTKNGIILCISAEIRNIRFDTSHTWWADRHCLVYSFEYQGQKYEHVEHFNDESTRNNYALELAEDKKKLQYIKINILFKLYYKSMYDKHLIETSRNRDLSILNK